MANIDKSHLELFLLTKLAIAFEFYADEQTAIDSFFPDREVKPFDILTYVEKQSGATGNKATPVEANC